MKGTPADSSQVPGEWSAHFTVSAEVLQGIPQMGTALGSCLTGPEMGSAGEPSRWASPDSGLPPDEGDARRLCPSSQGEVCPFDCFGECRGNTYLNILRGCQPAGRPSGCLAWLACLFVSQDKPLLKLLSCLEIKMPWNRGTPCSRASSCIDYEALHGMLVPGTPTDCRSIPPCRMRVVYPG